MTEVDDGYEADGESRAGDHTTAPESTPGSHSEEGSKFYLPLAAAMMSLSEWR